eukprot:TRINITY_DN7546_c0_g2_i4.p1 TRINITY_DN7546_c0_g2~~TRINITY_DN7546_c0_g2_i4.p1  ORF type:complete len:1956 (+),score=297.35 TRINITY_DN7546_c0_g2_i4:258-5870(+)
MLYACYDKAWHCSGEDSGATCSDVGLLGCPTILLDVTFDKTWTSVYAACRDYVTHCSWDNSIFKASNCQQLSGAECSGAGEEDGVLIHPDNDFKLIVSCYSESAADEARPVLCPLTAPDTVGGSCTPMGSSPCTPGGPKYRNVAISMDAAAKLTVGCAQDGYSYCNVDIGAPAISCSNPPGMVTPCTTITQGFFVLPSGKTGVGCHEEYKICITGDPTASPSESPTLGPTLQPTLTPTAAPTAEPSRHPSMPPTHGPSASPTVEPSAAPSAGPSESPSAGPTLGPTSRPTSRPTWTPSQPPSGAPTMRPTASPTIVPTYRPSLGPSAGPSGAPSEQPTSRPTAEPSPGPTQGPSAGPTPGPSAVPTLEPTGRPSPRPTATPSATPSRMPTGRPSARPTMRPSLAPSQAPTDRPTARPTMKPTAAPSRMPTGRPSARPTMRPSLAPSQAPTDRPTANPTAKPTAAPSRTPTGRPSARPTMKPTATPSQVPTGAPAREPSGAPSNTPTIQPTQRPSRAPTSSPTQSPRMTPTWPPTNSPSKPPSFSPSAAPSGEPSAGPTQRPQGAPSREPTSRPSGRPTAGPTPAPTAGPTRAPTSSPQSLPTARPSWGPTAVPSPGPSAAPSASPLGSPSTSPSWAPSQSPSQAPSAAPSQSPTASPLGPTLPPASPSASPTAAPASPSASPTAAPAQPTAPPARPTAAPGKPTGAPATPTASPVWPTAPAPPSAGPSGAPSTSWFLPPPPSTAPSVSPTMAPQGAPTANPSAPPTVSPSLSPTASPQGTPTANPSAAPTVSPSGTPSIPPTASPLGSPSVAPSAPPTAAPQVSPSVAPTAAPQGAPSTAPSAAPTAAPLSVPSASPSPSPTAAPRHPSAAPSAPPQLPSAPPSAAPTSPPAAPSAPPTAPPAGPPTAPPSQPPSQPPVRPPTLPPAVPPTAAPQPAPVPTQSPTTSPTTSPTDSPAAQPSGPPSASVALPPPTGSPQLPSQSPRPWGAPPTAAPVATAHVHITWQQATAELLRSSLQQVELVHLQLSDKPTGAAERHARELATTARFAANPEVRIISTGDAPGGSPITVVSDVPPKQWQWNEQYEGLPAAAASGVKVTADVATDRQSLSVRLEGTGYRLRSPHTETLHMRFAPGAFADEASYGAYCQSTDPPCADIKLGTLYGEQPRHVPQAAQQVMEQGEVAAVAAATGGTVLAAAAGGGAAAGNLARLAMVQNVLKCPEPEGGDPQPLPPSLNPLQMAFGHFSNPVRYARGTVVGDSIILAVALAGVSMGLWLQRMRWRRRCEDARKLGKGQPKHSLRTMLIQARAGWLLVPVSFIYGGVIVAVIMMYSEGDSAGYIVLGTVNLLLFSAGLLYYACRAARAAPSYTRWVPLSAEDRPKGWRWAIWGSSEWQPIPEVGSTYKLLALHHLVYDGYRGGVFRFTFAMELVYSMLLAAVSAWSPANLDECKIQGILLAVCPLLWALYVGALRPYIAPYENALDFVIAAAEGVMVSIAVSGLFAEPGSWHDGATGVCGMIATWAVTIKSIADLIVFMIDEYLLFDEHVGGNAGCGSFCRWIICCQGQLTHECGSGCFTCRMALGQEDVISSDDDDDHGVDASQRRFKHADSDSGELLQVLNVAHKLQDGEPAVTPRGLVPMLSVDPVELEDDSGPSLYATGLPSPDSDAAMESPSYHPGDQQGLAASHGPPGSAGRTGRFAAFSHRVSGGRGRPGSLQAAGWRRRPTVETDGSSAALRDGDSQWGGSVRSGSQMPWRSTSASGMPHGMGSSAPSRTPRALRPGMLTPDRGAMPRRTSGTPGPRRESMRNFAGESTLASTSPGSAYQRAARRVSGSGSDPQRRGSQPLSWGSQPLPGAGALGSDIPAEEMSFI